MPCCLDTPAIIYLRNVLNGRNDSNAIRWLVQSNVIYETSHTSLGSIRIGQTLGGVVLTGMMVSSTMVELLDKCIPENDPNPENSRIAAKLTLSPLLFILLFLEMESGFFGGGSELGDEFWPSSAVSLVLSALSCAGILQHSRRIEGDGVQATSLVE